VERCGQACTACAGHAQRNWHACAPRPNAALERDALRARLNPHFMFNALNNLRALILEDPERARDMVTRLSRTLRQALAHNRSEQVTLAEELAVVDDYLAIEAVHFEQRLQVRQQIDADATQAQLPAMALQLLVENAIKHGIASRPAAARCRSAPRWTMTCCGCRWTIHFNRQRTHPWPWRRPGLPACAAGHAWPIRAAAGR
jgi:hypothetical protein